VRSIEDTLSKLFIRLKTYKYRNHNRYKQYMLADKGYYSKHNINRLKTEGYIPIISVNRRNTKSKQLKELSKREKIIYKKRLKVENYFGWIKRYPKIDKLYEKNIDNYYSLLLLVSAILIINRNQNIK
jgi:DDE family transposase